MLITKRGYDVVCKLISKHVLSTVAWFIKCDFDPNICENGTFCRAAIVNFKNTLDTPLFTGEAKLLLFILMLPVFKRRAPPRMRGPLCKGPGIEKPLQSTLVAIKIHSKTKKE